ncbi:MAG: hypothetical protein RMZ69_19845 [Nostoc sp. ChiQUE01a]|nr:hypothetical protein [Nostoc sp. ChiQUE01a]
MKVVICQKSLVRFLSTFTFRNIVLFIPTDLLIPRVSFHHWLTSAVKVASISEICSSSILLAIAKLILGDDYGGKLRGFH